MFFYIMYASRIGPLWLFMRLHSDMVVAQRALRLCSPRDKRSVQGTHD
jgi:hypothetical protein